ncbi:MAG: hypothetical protein R3F56_20205 [Planctomycetota bacterium]
MELEFSDSDAVTDFTSVPPGTYLCEVSDVRPGVTRHGEERWSFRLTVREGEFAGRQAAWDSLTFGERALPRVRRVFAALGLPSEGRVRVEAKDLEGRRAFVDVRPTEYRNALGEVVRRNEVPYSGYRPLPEPGQVPF